MLDILAEKLRFNFTLVNSVDGSLGTEVRIGNMLIANTLIKNMLIERSMLIKNVWIKKN
jgi:hypothetical protein